MGRHCGHVPYVSGDAIDIGLLDAAAWLSEHGAEYGLCQIYGNEPWHYELRPEAIDRGCAPPVRRPYPSSQDAAVTGVSACPVAAFGAFSA